MGISWIYVGVNGLELIVFVSVDDVPILLYIGTYNFVHNIQHKLFFETA